MAKHMKECRVCGKQYVACNSARTGSPIFNWREVSCSPECGEVYLQRVMEARSNKTTEKVKKAKINKDEDSSSNQENSLAGTTAARSVEHDGVVIDTCCAYEV